MLTTHWPLSSLMLLFVCLLFFTGKRRASRDIPNSCQSTVTMPTPTGHSSGPLLASARRRGVSCCLSCWRCSRRGHWAPRPANATAPPPRLLPLPPPCSRLQRRLTSRAPCCTRRTRCAPCRCVPLPHSSSVLHGLPLLLSSSSSRMSMLPTLSLQLLLLLSRLAVLPTALRCRPQRRGWMRLFVSFPPT